MMEEELKKLQELLRIDTKKMKDSFQGSIDAIKSIFQRYSVEDVATSLFVSNLWLPNIASPVKHEFLTAIFATLKPEGFSAQNLINTYADFKGFLENVYPLIPPFPSIEDFIPEPDWGEIRFHCNKKNYRMFYGNELSNVHEYLMIFQMLYETYEDEYEKHSKRNPKYELIQCLLLQEAIIKGICGQPQKDALDISTGDLEYPPERFWKSAQTFYSGIKPENIVTEDFVKRFSIKIGEYAEDSLKFEEFINKVPTGTLLPTFFVKHESRYFPILPRSYSSILFDNWTELFKKYSEIVEPDKKKYTLRLGAKVHKYIKGRIGACNLFPLVSAVTEKAKPHETIFASSFISGNKLILVYLTEPTIDSKNTKKELKKLVTQFKRVEKLVARQPATLALHLSQQNVQYQSKSQSDLKAEIVTIIPQVSTQMQPFLIPKDLPGRVMPLDSFLGIIDELESADILSDFLDYFDEVKNKTHPILSMLDMFASFKDSYGTLIGGALEFDRILIDPHWGTSLRYNTLSEFWELYPEIDFFGHPRTWSLRQETDTRLRLLARGYPGSAIYSKFGQTNVFITAPFHEMEYKRGNLSNLLMECLEDSMTKRQYIFREHEFFKQYDILRVIFFPVSLAIENEAFQHLKHLTKVEKYWLSDIIRLNKNTYGIRVVFNEDEIRKAFTDAEDCSIEVDILIEVLEQANIILPDAQIKSITESLEKTKIGKPRFKMFSAEKPASFPEFISALEPKLEHFKKAKKRIAELARQLNINEGEYELDDAKKVLNDLRDVIVSEINSEVSMYDFTQAIPFLLARIDALNADYEQHRYMIERSLEHEIDFQPEVQHAEKHKHYKNIHKSYRYLIEKFVQLEAPGKNILKAKQFQYLIALIDWLHVFYSASDNIHYGILPVGMKLNREYLVDVIYEEDIETKDKAFAEFIANLDLGIIGNPNDRLVSPRPAREFFDALDDAFTKDMGFGFQSMVNVLQIMCYWPSYAHNVEESTSYNATIKEIEELCVKNIKDITNDEVKLITDFMTLKKDDVIRVLGQDEPCPDLPVWEYKKRYARYNLKPLIKIGEQYHWGAYSVRRTALIWSSRTSIGATPADLQARNIEKELRTEKKLIEDALADKTFEIVTRFTNYARKNLELHNLEPKGSHPAELGDYDVLSFHQDKNIILSIECKDILPPFCLKDTKRLREKIFGRPEKDQGHFEQINKRTAYLREQVADVAKALNWPIDENNHPKIISIYLSRRIYWWTNYPPEGIDTVFIRLDLLSDFIKK